MNSKKLFQNFSFKIMLAGVCCLAHIGVGASLNFSGLTLLQLTEPKTSINESFVNSGIFDNLTTPDKINTSMFYDYVHINKSEIAISNINSTQLCIELNEKQKNRTSQNNMKYNCKIEEIQPFDIILDKNEAAFFGKKCFAPIYQIN